MNINQKVQIRKVLKDVGATSVIFRRRGRNRNQLALSVEMPGTDPITIRSFINQALRSEKVNFYMTSGGYGSMTVRVIEKYSEPNLIDVTELAPPPKDDRLEIWELADKLDRSSTDIIRFLFKQGIMVTPNSKIDAATVELVKTEFGYPFEGFKKPEVLPALSGWKADLVKDHDDLHAKTKVIFNFIRSEDLDDLELEDQWLLVTQMKLMGRLGKLMAERIIRHKLQPYSKAIQIQVN